MNYCPNCGTKLITKIDGIDGETPYCETCQKFVYPTFNSAISSIILNPAMDHILLIEQYQSKANILVAGYVMKGEEDIITLQREIKEEVDLDITGFYYNDDAYFKKTNTLLHNYIVIASSMDYHLTNEVDEAMWFPLDQAKEMIKPHSLAEHFLLEGLKKIPHLSKEDFNTDFTKRAF